MTFESVPQPDFLGHPELPEGQGEEKSFTIGETTAPNFNASWTPILSFYQRNVALDYLMKTPMLWFK